MSRRKIKAKQPKKKQHDFDNVVPIETPSMRAVEGSISDFMGESDSSEPRDRAQQLMYDAWEEPNRRTRRKLIKQALEIYPDCVDAFVCLAEDSHDPEEAIPLYERALEAGGRDLGSKMFAEDAGHFWGILDTRPYMRAKEGLAAIGLREAWKKTPGALGWLEERSLR